jgi:hypothetical protein
MSKYKGDIISGATIYEMWYTNDSGGASVNPTVNGTISVYKDDGTTQTVTGVTDTRAFDGLVGVHVVKIETTDAFYAVGHDYSVVLSAATIDGNVVNCVLFTFSIQNRVVSSVTGAVGSVSGAVSITSNADMTAILADTNELQGLISSSKIAAQVKGIDADAITALALKTDAVNEITAAIWAKVVDGTITFEKMSKILLAFTSGKVVITSNSFAFYDQSNALLFTLPITTSGRIPVIA